MSTFGERITAAREALAISQPALAAASGVPQSSIAQYESLDRGPSLANAIKLQHALYDLATAKGIDPCMVDVIGGAR